MASGITLSKSLRRAFAVTALGREASKAGSAQPEKLAVLIAKIIFAEFLAVSAAAYMTSTLYYVVVLQQFPSTRAYGYAALFIASLIVLISLGLRHHAMLQTQTRHRFLWSGIGAVALAFSFFLSTLFLLKVTDSYSRATFVFQLVGVTIAVLSARAIGYSAIRTAIGSGRVKARRIVLIGDEANYADVKEKLNEGGIHTVRSFAFPHGPESSSADLESTFDLQMVQKVIENCRRVQPDDIVILATAAELPRSARLADVLSQLPVSLHVIPVETKELLGTAHLGNLGALVTIQILHAPLTVFDRLLKRGFDIAAAVVGLLVLSPLLLLVALAIKLDSRGPVLFRQTRHGYNNAKIQVFKFRSMTTMEDGQAFRQATRSDPRVTAVGRIIRRTNIDELPQLINVLQGNMSIVGPRPHPVALNRTFEKQISPLSRRHNVKPGITGWAQVNGYRGETDTLQKMQGRFECDLYYIDNWTFLLDMKILVMTLFSKQAYLNAY